MIKFLKGGGGYTPQDVELPIDYNTVHDTEEHQIGYYKVTGGYKPLYRKIVIYPVTGTIGGGGAIRHVDIPHNIDNLEYCISCASSISSSNGADSSYIIPNMGGATGPACATIVARVTASYIVLRILNDSWSTGMTFIFTPEYTKTTDTVVAEIPKQTIPGVVQKYIDTVPVGTELEYNGGTVPSGWAEVEDPNVYSTSETKTNKIWIDGKPIYRKVFNFKTTSASLTIQTGLTDIDKVTYIGGMYRRFSTFASYYISEHL